MEDEKIRKLNKASVQLITVTEPAFFILFEQGANEGALASCSTVVPMNPSMGTKKLGPLRTYKYLIQKMIKV